MTKRSLLRNVSIGIGSVRSPANRRRKLNKSNRVGWAAPSVFYLSPTILSYDLVSRVCPSASTILSSVYNPKEPRTNPLSEIFRGLLLPVVTRRNGPVRKNLALSDPPPLSSLRIKCSSSPLRVRRGSSRRRGCVTPYYRLYCALQRFLRWMKWWIIHPDRLSLV